MKQLYILTSLLLLTFSEVNAQTGPYYWQVQSINSISGGNTYNQNATPNDIILDIYQCSGGNGQPNNLTNYTLTWYVNSTNSNSGGTVYSTSSDTTTTNFNPTLNFTPPTDVTGTFYYYAEFSNPSMTTCGFTSTLISPTVEVTINCNSTTGTDTRTECDSLVWIDGNTYYTNNNTATFNITGGAASLCDSLVTLNLTINTIDISVTQTGILLTSEESGASYQWVNCPALTIITDSTNQSFTPNTNGDYAVIVTKNGCSDTSNCHTVSTVGIIENDFENELLLYPNPTDGNFSIDLGQIYQSATVSITDINGRLIVSETYNQSQLLNVKLEEPAGIYLLKIQSGNKKAVIRLIKK